MFSNNMKNTIAKSMDMNSDELDQFVKRFLGHINANLYETHITKNIVLHGLQLVSKVKKESIEKKKQKREIINFGSMRNVFIRKYGTTILGLRDDENYGAQRIGTYLKTHHNIKLAKATIERFLKLNEVQNNR